MENKTNAEKKFYKKQLTIASKTIVGLVASIGLLLTSAGIMAEWRNFEQKSTKEEMATKEYVQKERVVDGLSAGVMGVGILTAIGSLAGCGVAVYKSEKEYEQEIGKERLM